MKEKTKFLGFLEMTKADFMLAIALLMAGALCFVAIIYFNSIPGGQVEVKVGGKVTGTYSLNKDREILIEELGRNILRIEDGIVFMVEADCPDQYCVKHRPISRNGESIICLPNQVVATVRGGDESDVDGVTN